MVEIACNCHFGVNACKSIRQHPVIRQARNFSGKQSAEKEVLLP